MNMKRKYENGKKEIVPVIKSMPEKIGFLSNSLRTSKPITTILCGANNWSNPSCFLLNTNHTAIRLWPVPSYAIQNRPTLSNIILQADLAKKLAPYEKMSF